MRNTHKLGFVPISTPIILFLVITIHVTLAADYVPTEKILLSRGGTDNTDSDGWKWTMDIGSKYLSANVKSTASLATTQDPSVPTVPYMTARVFPSNFTYSILVVAALNFAFLVKEYSINVEGATLDVSFIPSAKAPRAYAFVNGIEIVSMPDIYSFTDGTLMIVGQGASFYIDNSTALKNVYRLNVGGDDISPSHDTGLYRSWADDLPYLYGPTFGVSFSADYMTIQYPTGMPIFVAPVDVYDTARSIGPNPEININYNLTWIFSVGSRFSYLVRLHFYEIQGNITKINRRVFNIFLYNQTAKQGADVIAWANKQDRVAVYRDYVVLVPNGSPQQNMWLALHPNPSSKPDYYDVTLSGVEIFKVNGTNGNLAGPNPIPAPKQDLIDPTRARPSSGHGKTKNQKAIIIGVVTGGIVLAFVIRFFVIASYRCQHGKDLSAREVPSRWHQKHGHGKDSSARGVPSRWHQEHGRGFTKNLYRCFSFAEIKVATKDFDEALLLGEVYKGEIDDGAIKVAIKRRNPLSDQGVHKFQTVIEMLSKVRHHHLAETSMAEVLWNLELSLQLQASAKEINEGIAKMHIEEETFVPHVWKKDSDASPSYDGCGGSFSREVTCQKLNVGHLWIGFF
nr:receptor-like protein kinase feronia [Quercus suber]